MSDEIVVSTSPGCPDCTALKSWLTQQGFAYAERDLSQPGVAEEAKSRYGVRVAPITIARGRVFCGTFSAQRPEIEAALHRR